MHLAFEEKGRNRKINRSGGVQMHPRVVERRRMKEMCGNFKCNRLLASDFDI